MTITLQAVNELIQSLESAGELSIKERKYLELAKAYVQLAAENVAIKTMNDCLSEELRGYESDGAFEGPMMHLLWWQAEIPATSAYLAGIKADGVEQAANECYGAGYICETLLAYAQQLREGADK